MSVKYIRAFVLGFMDMLRGSFGRTNTLDHYWNECYDRGGNAAARLFGEG